MLLNIFIIIFIIGIILLILSHIDFDKLYNCEELFYTFGCISSIFGIIAIVISIIIICNNYIGMDAKINKNKETYKALVYKLENEDYRDDFGLLNKEVIDEIQNWNEDVVYYKTIQNDYWIGVYYPNVFDQFDTINYENIKIKEK